MKRLTKTIFLALAGFLFLYTSCDKVEEPYLKQISSEGPEPQEKIRKVLLEEYTGHKCPNCPEGAAEASKLKSIYGEQLVLLTIHSGYYSSPDATGYFTTDLRTSEGTELHDFFGFFYWPVGMVNRIPYNGNRQISKDDWEPAIGSIIEEEARAGIAITAVYNEATRKLNCTLESEFYEDLDGTFNICIFLTESGIVAPQQNGTFVDTTYVHNHVLRGALNGAWGDLVGEDGQAISGIKLTNEYSLTLDNEWIEDNCHLVAFIYNTVTSEIVQAEEAALIPEE